MRITIDSSNIKSGGGVTHLSELLKAVDLHDFGIKKMTVWGANSTLDILPDHKQLNKMSHPLLNKANYSNWYWRNYIFPNNLLNDCDLLFVPGGSYIGNFKPFVTMFRNLLPFDRVARNRFKFSFRLLRYLYLRKIQTNTIRRASGVIFVSKNAQMQFENDTGFRHQQSKVIYHGINPRFSYSPRPQYPISKYDAKNPYKLVYVSIINHYKHQDNVVRAIGALRKKGYPLELELVGPAYKPALNNLYKVIKEVDTNNDFIHYKGKISYDSLETQYFKCDGFIFASSCEAFGQILTEAMSAGLPIACSNRSALPEVLGKCGIFFDPENLESIIIAIETLISDEKLRSRLAAAAYKRSKDFTWGKCARETFEFLTKCSVKNNLNKISSC
jgi:glycosyltransferase involved in cell wall biosynthesis